MEVDEHNDPDEFARNMHFVSNEKQQQIVKFRFDIDKKLSLYSEIIVRQLACKELNIENEDLIFDRNEFGKPYLIDYPEFHFNISHTRNAIAVAISDKPVGIDIERIKDADLNIARRFFTEQEQAYILCNELDQLKRFYEIWTKKEAYIKYMGKGLSIPLKSFDVTEYVIRDRINCFEINGYAVSVCRDDETRRSDIKIISEEELLKLIAESLMFT